MAGKPDKTVLSFYDSLLKESDVNTLTEGCWLNDKIIGFVFEWVDIFIFYCLEPQHRLNMKNLIISPIEEVVLVLDTICNPVSDTLLECVLQVQVRNWTNGHIVDLSRLIKSKFIIWLGSGRGPSWNDTC